MSMAIELWPSCPRLHTRQTDRQTVRQTVRQTYRWTDRIRKSVGQTDRQTDTYQMLHVSRRQTISQTDRKIGI